jgi:hypothetical protein
VNLTGKSSTATRASRGVVVGRLDLGPALAGAVALGDVLLLISFLAVRWFAIDQPEGGQAFIPFSSLNHLNFYSPTTGLHAHFETLAWLCAAIATAGAVGSLLTLGRARRPPAILGVVGALTGLSLVGFEVRVTDGASYSTWLGWADNGLWLAVVGFVLLGGAALIRYRA